MAALTILRNMAMKGAVSLTSYLGIIIATRIGGIFLEYVIYSPYAILFAFISDFGRSEISVKCGLSDARAGYAKNLMFACMAGLIILAMLNLKVDFQLPTMIVILVAGLMQGGIDIILKATFYYTRGQNIVLRYQLLLALIFILSDALSSKLSSRSSATLLLVVYLLASAFLSLYILRYLRSRHPISETRSAVLPWYFVMARLYLPAIYFAGNTFVSAMEFGIESKLALRCLYFSASFLHFSVMARQFESSYFWNFICCIVLSVGAYIPVWLISDHGGSLIGPLMVIIIFSIPFSYFSFMYGKFLVQK